MSNMKIEYAATFLPAIEEELHRAILQSDNPNLDEYRYMLAYHLGWEGEAVGPEARGKRIRPIILLLTCAAAGGNWLNALPAAAAVELVHNFSLIHDDIQDNSPLRRGRPTVWKHWGVAQAINAGDAMFTLAHLSLLRLEETATPGIAIQAARILQLACLHLTEGQFLDLAYEAHGDLSLEAYWQMVGGKTAALLAACTELGALVAGVADGQRQSYRQFGYSLGLAFQAQDDILGIWGNAALTGKSAESDLLSGKKTLPVLYGLTQEGAFSRRWSQGPVTPEEIQSLTALLEAEGGRAYTQAAASRMTEQALQALTAAQPLGEAGQALIALADQLLGRQG